MKQHGIILHDQDVKYWETQIESTTKALLRGRLTPLRIISMIASFAMLKPSHITINNAPVKFFDSVNRFLVTPELMTLLKDDATEMTFDVTHEHWLDQVWECMDDVARLLEWREITTKPIHLSRSLISVEETKDADLVDARHVLNRDEPTITVELMKNKEKQHSHESSLFVNKKDEYINDEQWCAAVADSFCRLLGTLAINKVAMNVFGFLDLLALANTAITHTDDRKMYIELVGFELHSRASIAVLRGEELL